MVEEAPRPRSTLMFTLKKFRVLSANGFSGLESPVLQERAALPVEEAACSVDETCRQFERRPRSTNQAFFLCCNSFVQRTRRLSFWEAASFNEPGGLFVRKMPRSTSGAAYLLGKCLVQRAERFSSWETVSFNERERFALKKDLCPGDKRLVQLCEHLVRPLTPHPLPG